MLLTAKDAKSAKASKRRRIYRRKLSERRYSVGHKKHDKHEFIL